MALIFFLAHTLTPCPPHPLPKKQSCTLKVELLKANKAHPDRRKGKERAKKAPKGFKKKHTYKDRYKDD